MKASHSLLVSGRLSNGVARLEPAFLLPVAPSLPASGDHVLEGLDADGKRLFAVPFDLQKVGCLPSSQASDHFAFTLPCDEATAARLAELRWTRFGESMARLAPQLSARVSSEAPLAQLDQTLDGQARLHWDITRHPSVLVRDPETGEILAMGRSGDLRLPDPGRPVEVHLSLGTHSVRTLLQPRPFSN